MANFTIAKPIILALEGGLSNNPNDNAAKHPAPNGYHTNKGITWQTFTANAKALGYSADLNTFMQMPDEIVFKIAKTQYWDALKLDAVNSNKKAYLAFDWAFNSGTVTAILHIQRLLSITADGVAGPQFVSAVNAKSESNFSELITAARVAFIENSSKIKESIKPGLVSRVEKLLKKNFLLT